MYIKNTEHEPPSPSTHPLNHQGTPDVHISYAWCTHQLRVSYQAAPRLCPCTRTRVHFPRVVGEVDRMDCLRCLEQLAVVLLLHDGSVSHASRPLDLA